MDKDIEGQPKKFSSPKFRDVFWALLFYVCFFGTIALLGVSISRYWNWNEDEQSARDDVVITAVNAINITYVLGIGALIGLGLSTVWMILLFVATKALIIASMVLTVALWILLGIYFFLSGSLTGVLFIIIGVIVAFFFYMWQDRIDFAVVLLKAVIHVVKEYPSIIGTGLLSVFLNLIWLIIWVITLTLVLRFQETGAVLLFIYLLFMFYWVTQVIKHTLHTTASGTFATWYFMSADMPDNPTAQSFRRAVTYSFGSICLGSLFIATIKTIRSLIKLTRDRIGFIAVLADCILSCLDWLLQYFNHYALVIVAVYGKSYIKAAKETFDLFRRTGVLILVNDNIIGTVLGLGSLLAGIITSVICVAITWNWFDTDTFFIAIITFFIAFSMVEVTNEIIESGVSTFFVCFAEDPSALMRQNENLYIRLNEAMRR